MTTAVAAAMTASTMKTTTTTTTLIKPVLVTGGNKGIGKAICTKLLREYPNVHVLLGARSLEKGQQAVQDIKQQVGETVCANRLDCVIIDVSDNQSVQDAAREVQTLLQQQKSGTPLYGICNNAGVLHVTCVQDLVNVNYFGLQRVNEAFGGMLQRPGGRIVNIASGAAPFFVQNHCLDQRLQQVLTEPWRIKNQGIQGLNALVQTYPIDRHDLNEPLEPYGFTKACINAYTWLLAQQEPDLVINSVTPGWIDTDMTVGQGATNPPEVGAIPPTYLLMDDEVAQTPTGRYYGSDCKRSPWHKYRSPGSPEYTGPDDGPDDSTMT